MTVEDKSGTKSLGELTRKTALSKRGNSNFVYDYKTTDKKGTRTAYYNSSIDFEQPAATFRPGEEIRFNYKSRNYWGGANAVYGVPDVYLGQRKFSVKINHSGPLPNAGNSMMYDLTLHGLRAPQGKAGQEFCITVYLCGDGSDPGGRSNVKYFYTWRGSESSGKKAGTSPFDVDTVDIRR